MRARLDRLTEQWRPTPSPAVEPPGEDLGREVRWRLGRRAFRGLAVIVAGLLIIVGWGWWQSQPRSVTMAGEPDVVASAAVAADGPALAGSEVVVHVVGLVRSPGLVHLPAGSRVAAAIDAAGGATDPEALATVNLARVVVDGEQITVGAQATDLPGVSLNQATAAQLEELPGVGPVLAGRIVAWRESHGPFRSVDELDEVAGIGAALLEQLRPQVRM